MWGWFRCFGAGALLLGSVPALCQQDTNVIRQARDAFGNTVKNYFGTVHFQSSERRLASGPPRIPSVDLPAAATAQPSLGDGGHDHSERQELTRRGREPAPCSQRERDRDGGGREHPQCGEAPGARGEEGQEPERPSEPGRNDRSAGGGGSPAARRVGDRVAIRVTKPLRKPVTTYAMFERTDEQSKMMEAQ